MDRSIRSFAPDELTALSRLAERLNARRETGSTFCCSSADDIRRDLAQPAGFACWEDNRPLGLVFCFHDREKANADVSLLLDLTGEDYHTIAERLLSAARRALGPETACTFFFPAENTLCRDFLEQSGARRQENEYILRLRREEWKNSQDLPALRPARDSDRDSFIALHDAIFPGAYASGKEIWADLGQTRHVFVLPDAAGLAAYGVLRSRGDAVATAEMIGVREDARRQGFGRAALNRLAEEAFGPFRAQELELVVDANNDTALRLYFHTGFRLRQENLCYILPGRKL